MHVHREACAPPVCGRAPTVRSASAVAGALPWKLRGSARCTGSSGLGDTAASFPAGGGTVRGAESASRTVTSRSGHRGRARPSGARPSLAEYRACRCGRQARTSRTPARAGEGAARRVTAWCASVPWHGSGRCVTVPRAAARARRLGRPSLSHARIHRAYAPFRPTGSLSASRRRSSLASPGARTRDSGAPRRSPPLPVALRRFLSLSVGLLAARRAPMRPARRHPAHASYAPPVRRSRAPLMAAWAQHGPWRCGISPQLGPSWPIRRDQHADRAMPKLSASCA